MNRKLKIIFLLLAILLAVGGVLYFMKTIVSPPKAQEFTNQHIASLQEDVARLGKNGRTAGKAQADSLFNTTVHAAGLFCKEGLISAAEGDKVLTELMKNYVPLCVAHYDSIFAQSQWQSTDLARIERDVRQLTTCHKLEDSRQLLADDAQLQQLRKANAVVDDYHKAVALTNQKAFRGLDAARTTIAQASKYARTPPLSNCSELVDTLIAMPEKLEEAHYHFIEDKVKSMANYRTLSENYYMYTLAKDVNDAIKAYLESAEATYGSAANKGSVRRLKDRADSLYIKADSFYLDKKKLNNGSSGVIGSIIKAIKQL